MKNTLRVLITPDKYKGTLTAAEVCESLEKGITGRYPFAEIRKLPLADGGDGTLEVLQQYLSLKPCNVDTLDPLGRPIQATYLANKSEAFIEVASASGIVLLQPHERNVMKTSSYGTGLIIKHALEKGKTDIYLLLGGSATNDIGLGIAEALGVTFEGTAQKSVSGGMLNEIRSIKLPAEPIWSNANFILLCDVDNPLYGERGAAQVYARQKGASDQDIEQLDSSAKHIASLLQAFAKTPIASMPGTGAAGGIGAGMVALMGAKLQSGFDTISNLTQLEHHIAWADEVITGEGQLDNQSFQGKVVGKVVESCTKLSRPCHIVVGNSTLGDTFELPKCIKSVITLTKHAPSVEVAMKEGKRILKSIGENNLILNSNGPQR